MKQKLLNNFRLRALMLVAILCAAFTGAWAEDVTYKLTITASDFNTTSYAANNNEKTSNAVCTTDNTKTYEVKWTSNQVMKNRSNMQWQKSKGYIYNSTDLGTITNVTVTSTGGTFTTYYGTKEQPTSGTTAGGGFFKTSVGSTTGTTSKVEVTFTISEGGGETPSLDDNDLALDPVELEFDLYDNASAQVINYTTSSTGAVTIDDSEYATFTINETAKTITVTPTAATPDVVTIIVNQAANDSYKAGSTTFDLLIDDSTPTPTHTATFSVNGVTTTEEVEEDAAITFPENPADVYGKTFVGWTASAITGTTNDAPTFVTSATMGQSDITFYAVFAYASGSGSSEVVDVLNNAWTGVSGNTYKVWSNKTATSDAVYAGNSAGDYNSIQLRTNNSNSGIVTTTSGGKVKKVVISWNYNTSDNRTVNVYGKNSAYSEAADLYNSTNQGDLLGTIVYGTSTELVITGDYEYVGLRSSSGALYLSEVQITWSTGGGASYSDYCTTVAADTRLESELSFAVAEVNANISEQFEAPTLNTATGFNGTVEYTSSDESVAQIMDSETGELRLLTGGTTTITATFAGNDDFRPGYASYTLTVTDNRIATTTTVENIVLDLSDVATLTQLNPVVKDAEDNIIDCTYEDFPPKVSYEIVSDDSYIIGSIDNNSGEITLNAVVGTATLKAYYNAFNVSSTYKPSECTFTITVESTQTIAEVRAQGSGDVTTKGIVTSCSGTTAYIQDANAAICVYGSSLTVGDEVKVSGTLSNFNGLLEITSPTVTVLSQNNTVTPEVMTIADINASSNQGWLVKIENATVTAINGQNTTIAQGENTIVVRNISGVELAVDDVVTLTGNIGYYNAAQIANPTDVTVVELEENTITVKQRYYYNEEYHFNDIPADPQYQIGIVNFEHITFVVEANGAIATAVSSDNTILEIQETDEANTFEAIGTGGSWEGQVATVTFTTPRTSTHEAAERTITFLVKRPAAPTFSIEPGTYGETQYVELRSITGISNYGFEPEYEPEIWYVTSDDEYDFENNNEPDQVHGHKYNGTPIEISKTTTIKAWTYRYDLNWSEAATATYIIDSTPSINIAETTINATADEAEGTVAITYSNLTISNMTDFGIQYYNAEGQETTEPDWIEVLVAEQDPSVGVGYVVSYYMIENEGEARTTYFKVYAIDNEDFIYSDLVTVNQEAYVASTGWQLTSLADLTEDDVFVIVGNNGDTYALSNDNGTSSAPSAVQVTVDGNKLTGFVPNNIQWTISGNANDGYTFHPYSEIEEWLYCTNSNNGVRVGTNTNNIFSMTDEGYLYNNSTDRYVGIYSSQDWRCYTSINNNITGQTFSFYKFVPDYTRDVTLNVEAGYSYGTICMPKSGQVVGAEIYSIAGKGEDNGSKYLSLEKVETEMEAGKPYIFKVTSNKLKMVYTDESTTVAGNNNGLIGSFTKKAITDANGNPEAGMGDDLYVLKNNEICPAGTNVSVGANKAYIDLSQVVNGSASGVKLFFEGSEDGIEGVTINGNAKEIYDLSGRRVIQPIRGIYIIDGKKVLVK